MPWVAPRTWVAEEYVNALMMNGLRDALNETAPAKATQAGELFRATAQNAIEAFGPGSAGELLKVDASGLPQFVSIITALGAQHQYTDGTVNTTSSSPVALTGGPAVTVTAPASGNFLIAMFADMFQSSASAFAVMSLHDGAALVGPGNVATVINIGHAALANTHGRVGVIEGYTPGANVTLTVRYSQSDGGTASFLRRFLFAMPL